MGYKLLEREHAFQLRIVVDNVDVVYLVHVLGLHSHLLDGLGHRPVFVNDNHLRAHKAAGGVFVVFQEVDDVAGLLYVVDVREDFVALVFVEGLDEVHGVVRVEVVDLLCDFLGGHVAEELAAVVLVKLHEHVGGLLLVQEAV